VPYVISDREERCEVAKIVFAFHNKKLLKLLAERGSVITSGKLDKLQSLNDKIMELSKNSEN